MSKYASREQLAAKIDWEGGIWQMLFEYGLHVGDMPDHELADLLNDINTLATPLQNLVYDFMEKLEEDAED